jgi:hypothetical protein
MTPPMKRSSIKQLLPRPRPKYEDNRPGKKDGTLSKAQAAWRIFSSESRDLSVPLWYAGLHGVPNWLLRQPISSKKMDEKRKGLALLVRMNYILDYVHQFELVTPQASFFLLPARKLRFFCRSFGPIYEDGAYRVISPGHRMNTSYALSTTFDWKRALACTVGNFVHLLSLSVSEREGGLWQTLRAS